MQIDQLPFWAHNVLNVNHAFGLKRLMRKTIGDTELSEQQNRLFLDKENVKVYLEPYLTSEEAAKAKPRRNVNEKGKGKRKREEEGGSISGTGGMHEGLNVSVYVQGGWKVELQLKLLVGREFANFFEGNEMEVLRVFSGLKEGDNVAIWMFRRHDKQNKKEKLCFLVVKI